MSHFKVKSKRRDCDTTVTLDRKHIQNLNKIEKNKAEFKIKQERLKEINELLKNENDTNRIIFLKDEKIKIEESIKSYENENAEINYFLDNGNLLFEYYNSLENDSITSKNNVKKDKKVMTFQS